MIVWLVVFAAFSESARGIVTLIRFVGIYRNTDKPDSLKLATSTKTNERKPAAPRSTMNQSSI